MDDSMRIDDFLADLLQGVTEDLGITAATPVPRPVPSPEPAGTPVPVEDELTKLLGEVDAAPAVPMGFQSGRQLPPGAKPFREIDAALKPSVETGTELFEGTLYPLGYVQLRVKTGWRFANKIALFLGELDQLESWVTSPQFAEFKAAAVALGLRNRGEKK